MVRPMRAQRRRREGLTIVEVALIVCVLGVSLAVFVPTFFREVRTSKIAEAPTMLADLHRAATAYYEERRAERGHCLPAAAGPTPATVDGSFREDAFTGPEAPTTWSALGFAPERTRYRYSFGPTFECAPEPGARVVYRAEADLDGDGTLSSFERHDEATEETLRTVDVLRVVDEVE